MARVERENGGEPVAGPRTTRRLSHPFPNTDGDSVVRPRLLFLGHTLPYPPDQGAALRSYHVLRVLARHYEVDALFFQRRREPTQMPLGDRLAHLRRLANVEVFPVPQEWSALRRWWDTIRGSASGSGKARWQFDSPRYRRRVLELVFERNPEVVHVDGMLLHPYLPLLEGHPVVLAHTRVESDRLRARAALAEGRDQARLERRAQWLERVERTWIPRVTLNTVSSELDRDRLAELAPEGRFEVVPLGVDVAHFTPGRETGQGLVFVGGAAGSANRDALDHFATDILPRLRRQLGMQALEPISWVGAIAEGDRARYRELGIDLTGYVEDVRPIVRPAACYVVPLRRGSGRTTRILQAWSMGKAVVSTSVGCAGLAAVDGENLLVRDDPQGFADAVVRLLRDPEPRRRLGEAGRRTVEVHHNWEDIGTSMLELYQSAGSAAVASASVHPGD